MNIKNFEDMVFCQSCMMPMNTSDCAEYGTEKDGSKSTDYCSYCYKDGAFVGKSTMEEVIEICIPYAIEGGAFKTADEARAGMLESFPKLKRWAS
jgi:hypothetical protein